MAEDVPTKKSNMYCIKCRSHTDNVDEREEQITSKGKPRSVLKATCAVCSKKKNRFIKREASTVVESKIISQKEFDQLMENFIERQNLAFDENNSK